MINNEDIKFLKMHLESNNGFAKQEALKALAIIARQNAENEALINGQETLQKHIEKQNVMIERLEKENAALQRDIMSCNKEVAYWKAKAKEARKEFAERLKLIIVIDLCEALDCSEYLDNILPKKIDNLLAEMESERKT